MTYTDGENTSTVGFSPAAIAPQEFVYGRYQARILSDGAIAYYREVLTPDRAELIGTEYPNEDYCWFNVRSAARNAGMTHDEIFEAEQALPHLIFTESYIAAHRAEWEVSS